MLFADNEIMDKNDFINYVNKIWDEVDDKIKIKKEPTSYNIFVKEMEIFQESH